MSASVVVALALSFLLFGVVGGILLCFFYLNQKMRVSRKATEEKLHHAKSKLKEIKHAKVQSSKKHQQPSDAQLGKEQAPKQADHSLDSLNQQLTEVLRARREDQKKIAEAKRDLEIVKKQARSLQKAQEEERAQRSSLERALEQSERSVATLKTEKAQLAEGLEKVKAEAEIFEQAAKEDHKLLQHQRKRIDTAELKHKELSDKLKQIEASQRDPNELVSALSRAEKAERSLEKTTTEMAKVNKEMAIVKDRLVGEISLRKRAEEKLESLASTSDVSSMSSSVYQMLDRAREELVAEQKMVRELKAQLEQGPKANPAGGIGQEEMLKRLEEMKSELSQEQIKVRDLRNRLQQETKSVPGKDVEQELEQTQKALQAEKEKVTALQKELSAASQQGATSSSAVDDRPISVMEALDLDPSFNLGQRETIRIIVNRFLGKKK